MPRNMDWLRRSGKLFLRDFEQYSRELSDFAHLEGMPAELSSGLQSFADIFETLSADVDEKEEEKEKALTDLHGFVSFFYNKGRQILDHMDPDQTEAFRKLVKKISDTMDLHVDIFNVFQPAEEMAFDGETMNFGQESVAEGFDKIVLKKKSPEELVEAPDLLNDRQKYLLQCPPEMQELAEMFRTKKSFRLLNWNSDLYNTAKNTLDAYMEQMSLASADYEQLLKDFGTGKISREDYTERVKRIGDLADKAAELLRRDMRAYAVHTTGGKDGQFGDLSVDGKTQATGAARLSASMGILSFLDRADIRIGMQTEKLSETRQNERVNEINFQRLYQKNFQDIEQESNRHRRAASLAQTERQLNREADAQVEAEAKQTPTAKVPGR